jgi:acyl carrier protein
MTRQEIHTKLAQLIHEKVDRRLAVEQIQLDSRLREDLGIDSLAVTEMLYEIEQVFGATIDISKPDAMQTVGDAVNAIAQELQVELAS